MKSTLTCFILTLFVSACLSSTPQGMKKFVDIKNTVVGRRDGIGDYLNSKYISVQSIIEVQLGVLEYSLIETEAHHPFEDHEKLCKFIFVVYKNTGVIIGWRYNGKPEYCYSGNT